MSKLAVVKASKPIDPINNGDQHQPKGIPYMGIDTEMVVMKDGKTLWPHQLGLPQERDTKLVGVTTDGVLRVYPTKISFDFHADGFAMELCVTPHSCLDNLMQVSLAPAFQFLAEKYGDVVKTPTIYQVPQNVMDAADKKVKQLGCMPSQNVYDDAGDPTVLGPRRRTTGCHLHISQNGLNDDKLIMNTVRWADILVGNSWTYISPSRRILEIYRRKAYGRAGEFRVKDYGSGNIKGYTSDFYRYGVEYRVLPGGVMSNTAYITLMLSLYRTALRFASEGVTPSEELSMAAKEAINNSDKERATEVMDALPFSPASRAMMDSLRAKPLKPMTAMEFSVAAGDAMGHRAYAIEAGLYDINTRSYSEPQTHTFHTSSRAVNASTRFINKTS